MPVPTQTIDDVDTDGVGESGEFSLHLHVPEFNSLHGNCHSPITSWYL